MKGVIFTEFIELVESTYGESMVDAILESADLPSGGVYTSVGTYDHREIVSLVGELSTKTGTPVPDLLKIYGVSIRPLYNPLSRALKRARLGVRFPRINRGLHPCGGEEALRNSGTSIL